MSTIGESAVPVGNGTRLRERLADGRLLVLPGAANALTARIIQDAGYDAVYVTGAGVANTFLGVPDIGLLTLTQMAEHVAAMADAVSVPLVVDADTGFGNAINTAHAVRVLERAGAAAIQLEDQTYPKRCGHFAGKDVIPSAEMVQKIHAAVDARADADLCVVARTDARATLGLNDAIDRAHAYQEAGADIIFLEAPESIEEIETVAREISGPQILNNVRGGATPELPHERVRELGFAIALYANLPLVATVAAVQATLSDLRVNGTSEGPLTQPVATWEERQRLVRRGEFAELEARYATDPVSHDC
jgi:2-methylisocitrate lyase-like PEP mutase family enzyme